VHHGVHGLVGQLRRKLDVGAIQGREGQEVEMQLRRRVAQIVWQPVGQRGFVLPGNRQLARAIITTAVDRSRDPAEVEPAAEAIAEAPQDAGRKGLRVGRIEGNRHLDRRLKVLGATGHKGKGPDVLQGEVLCDCADTPGARFVR
jgi:hypothetical protein